eukprot:CAMPEP_0196586672 /NCGR_PEP_ID=MMETSP1081-20130531/55175_1 /TAXON_ID=36882 /ORGANISM="Pyramimonas amylifera, Strain CCMP720" /LENGTH=71 /DNA_ID=CAMNT_0041908633 /DNA_START=118 /DNA_END=333 /DNA_ORIENTATION=-
MMHVHLFPVEFMEAGLHGLEGVADAGVVPQVQQRVRHVRRRDSTQTNFKPLRIPPHKPQLGLEFRDIPVDI